MSVRLPDSWLGLHARISTDEIPGSACGTLKLCDAGNLPDSSCEDRTDEVMSCAVAFTMTKSKRPELDLGCRGGRAMPQGPERLLR